MNKEEYIKQYTSEKYCQYDQEVIAFIAEILYDMRNAQDQIRSFFRSGYCYHFACILQSIFHRGELYLTEPCGHIVWMDTDGLAYDVEGPYLPEEHDCDRFIPVSFLGDTIYDFLHIPGKEYQAPTDFHKWAKSMEMSDTCAIIRVYLDMPKEDIDYQNVTLTQVAYHYWKDHQGT